MSLNISHTNTNLRVTLSCGPSTTALCTVLSAGGPCRRKLHGYARRLEPLGGWSVPVAARDGQPARRAKVLIAAAAVELVAPKQPRGDHGPDPLPLNVVVRAEVEAPEGAEPLEWILLSNRPAARPRGGRRDRRLVRVLGRSWRSCIRR